MFHQPVTQVAGDRSEAGQKSVFRPHWARACVQFLRRAFRVIGPLPPDLPPPLRLMLRELILTCVPPLVHSAATPGFRADEREAWPGTASAIVQKAVRGFCPDCHRSSNPPTGVDLESVSRISFTRNLDTCEKVARKLRARQMPPSDVPRPGESTYALFRHRLSTR
jgi:hypothetical protein